MQVFSVTDIQIIITMSQLSSRSNPLKCRICHEEYDLYSHIARIVPKCGHSYCQKCITLRLVVKANRKVFVCPECNIDVVIRKNVQEDVPKNLEIMNLVKENSLKKYTSEREEEKKGGMGMCVQHGKPFQMTCESCKYCKICSHCAFFGKHVGHTFCREAPASSTDLTELKNSFGIVSSSVEDYLLPGGSSNIKNAMRTRVTQGLRKHVEKAFRQFYDQIENKQVELLQECDNIIINEGGIDKNIDILVHQYDRLRHQYEIEFKMYTELGIAPQKGKSRLGAESIENFINKCNELHVNLQSVEQHSSDHINRIVKQIGTHIAQATIFKIQQLPFSIKRVVQIISNPDQGEVTSPSKRARFKSVNDPPKSRSVVNPALEKPGPKYKILDRDNKSQKNANLNNTTNIKDNLSQASKEPMNDDFSMNETIKSQLGFYKEGASQLKGLVSKKIIEGRPQERGSLPPKANKGKGIVRYETQVLNFKTLPKDKESANSLNGKQSKIIKGLSPAKTVLVVPHNRSMVQPEINLTQELKFVRPTKQISFQFLSRLQELIVEMDRQVQLNISTLQLNSGGINDVLLLYIVDYLRTKRYSFQVLKFTKNQITDEGVRILLSYLVNDNTTQVLNLTTNQLTARTLDLLLLFAKSNNVLRQIYLTNNKLITNTEFKQRKQQLEKYQFEIKM